MDKEAVKKKVQKVFYSSSACMYPEHNQLDAGNPNCIESSAYPANPDSEYGWEKLFSERIFLAYNRNFKLDKISFVCKNCSSLMRHAKAAEGKNPHLCPLANFDEPSALPVNVKRYLLLNE